MTKFIDSALEGRDITVYGDGSQSRTFCYIGDNVDTSVNALAHGKCVNEVVNIGNESEVSVLELAQQIVKVTGSRSRIMHVPPLPEGDMKRRKPDITRMRDLLGRELTPLSEGLEETIASRAAACQKS
jgi:UDP-glucose 4-epimerase